MVLNGSIEFPKFGTPFELSLTTIAILVGDQRQSIILEKRYPFLFVLFLGSIQFVVLHHWDYQIIKSADHDTIYSVVFNC